MDRPRDHNVTDAGSAAEREFRWRDDGDCPPGSAASAEAEAIYQDIGRTRDSLDRTFDELQRRVSPAYIAQRTMDSIKEKSNHMYRSTIQTIKDHPIPAAVAGLSVACLVACAVRDRNRQSNMTSYDDGRGFNGDGDGNAINRPTAAGKSRQMVESTKEAISHATQSAGQALHDMREAIVNRSHHVAESLGAKRRELKHKVERGYVATRDAAQHTFHDHPILMGVSVFAAGLALGAAFPTTRKEDELMGGYRDNLLDTAADRMRSGARKAVDAAAQRARRESLDDPARLIDDVRATTGGSASPTKVGEEVGRRAGAVVGEAVQAASSTIRRSSNPARQSDAEQSEFGV